MEVRLTESPIPDTQRDDPGNTLDSSQSADWVGLTQLPIRLQSAQLHQLSPTALAYLGDAVYELYIRSQYLTPPRRIQVYHHLVVSQVRAETQAQQVRSLLPHLTPEELDIVRRGRNAATGKPKRIDLDTYRHATSLETLVGYLYLTNPQRLIELLAHLDLTPDPPS